MMYQRYPGGGGSQNDSHLPCIYYGWCKEYIDVENHVSVASMDLIAKIDYNLTISAPALRYAARDSGNNVLPMIRYAPLYTTQSSIAITVSFFRLRMSSRIERSGLLCRHPNIVVLIKC